MCVSNMKLYLFTEIEAKEACDWLKAAGFPQYAQLYEGNTHVFNWSCFLVFVISFSILHPSILISLIVWPAAVYFQAPALVQRDGSWERPVSRCWDFSSLLFLYIFPPFSFHPVHSFPHCLSNIHSVFQSDLSICKYSVILTFEEKTTSSTFSVPFLFWI